MKKVNSLVLFLILCLAVFTSCENEFLEGEFATSNEEPTTPEEDACTLVEMQVAIVSQNFENATEDMQEALCDEYTEALENQILACGDPNDSLQQLIYDLPCSGCLEAQVATQLAFEAFDQVDPVDVDAYETLCGNYSFALQNQIALCGDPDGSLLELVLDLGDCAPPEEGPVRFLIEGEVQNYETASVTINGSLLSIVATQVGTGDTFTFNISLQQTGTNVLQSVQFTVDGDIHTPYLSGETPFINNITTNDGSTIIGTFSGTAVDANGELFITTEGSIDIAF